MIAANPLTSITILVNYSEDSKEQYEIVPFQLFQRDETFVAIPLVPDGIREKMQLPEQVEFRFADNRIIALSKGRSEVMINIVKELQMLDLV